MTPKNNPPIQKRTLEFGALDIAAQPHPKGIYTSLFRRARVLRRSIKILGNDYGEISSIHAEKNEKGVITHLRGSINRFTVIDPELAWFDVRTGEPATEEALADVRIPEHMRANNRSIHWVFVVKSHILVYARKNDEAAITPKQAAEFFGTLLNYAKLKFPDVDVVEVTTVKSAAAIDRIFAQPVVARLAIDIRRPNPDDPTQSNALARINRIMAQDGSQRWKEELHAPKGKSLKKSDRVQDLLLASQTTGKAEAVTYDENGKREDINTEETPHIERHVFKSDRKVSFAMWLTATALAIAIAITKRKK